MYLNYVLIIFNTLGNNVEWITADSDHNQSCPQYFFTQVFERMVHMQIKITL